MKPNQSADGDLDDQVQNAQQGEPDALEALRERCHPALVSILLARGATQSEAEEILADLWHDCVPGSSERPSLLSKFGGKFSILSWLARVAANRWIDMKRRASKHSSPEEADFDNLPGTPLTLEDDNLTLLLSDSLKAAFLICGGRNMVMLRLVYMHGLTQREVGKMLGWSETKTSRALTVSMKKIKEFTLTEIRRRDARLELEWEDFVGLCAGEGTDFL